MIKIRTALFEKVFVASIIPTALVIFFIPIYLISIFSGSSGNQIFLIIICSSFLLLFLSIIVCLFLEIKSKNYVIIEDDSMIIYTKNNCEQIPYNIIKKAKYYKCLWFLIPFCFFYKNQNGGIFEILLDNGKKYVFKIFYNDYKKINSKFSIIVL